MSFSKNQVSLHRSKRKINKRKIFLTILWSVFILAFAFAVYKNFTAVDTHTIHETKVIESRICDTSGIQSFVTKFINEFYTYSNNEEELRARTDKLSLYMADDLIKLNSDLISSDKELKSSVLNSSIWGIYERGENLWEVKYSVLQRVSTVNVEMKKETVTVEIDGKEVTKEVEKPDTKNISLSVESNYSVTLYIDDKDNMVIVKNPTITSVPTKSDYQSLEITADSSVDNSTSDEITHFLETFFKAYPTADSAALGYYAADGVLPVINKEYKFESLKEKVYRMEDKIVKAYLTVVYSNPKTGLKEYSQYILGLEKKDNNWQIVSSDYSV